MSKGRGGGVEGAIISYKLVGLTASEHTRFAEKVLGADQRVKGRTYRRRGVLDSVPHWRVNRGVIVVQAEDRAKVVREIHRWTADVVWWPIPLTRVQHRRLRAGP